MYTKIYRKITLSIFVGIAALLSTGCVVHAKPVAPVGKAVVIKRGHVHGKRCGHYRHGGHWYLVKGHVHGKRCGHHYAGGVWTIKVKKR